jgi:TPR repeat protein
LAKKVSSETLRYLGQQKIDFDQQKKLWVQKIVTSLDPSLSDLERHKLLADLGDINSQRLYGDMLFEGRGVTSNFREAANYFKMVADRGDAESAFKFGQMCLHGNGVAKNPVIAKLYLMAAVALGHETAIAEKDTWTKEIEDSLFGYYRDIARRGDVDAQRALGEQYFERKDFARAAQSFRDAARQGDPESQNRYGMMLLRGIGVVRNLGDARTHLTAAAAQGHEGATSERAVWTREIDALLSPKSPPPPPPPPRLPSSSLTSPRSPGLESLLSPFERDKKLADAGDVPAQFRVGEAYRTGRGVAISRGQAMDYLQMAADRGDAKAQYAYGMMRVGEGTEGELKAAKSYLKKAMRQMHAEAQDQYLSLFGYDDLD